MKEEYILMFDFGHGTRQYTKGKCSPDGSIYEGEWNREVGKRIFKEMRKLDIDCRIIVNEDEDISLQERCNRANKIVKDNPNKKCLYISIHINAAGVDGKWHNATGWAIYVARNASTKSKKLAKTLYDTALEMHLEGNRCIPAEHYWVAGYKVLRDTSCPAVLTENMFMDNKDDCKFLLSEEGKETIVNLHVIGLCKYMGIPYGYREGEK